MGTHDKQRISSKKLHYFTLKTNHAKANDNVKGNNGS